MNRQARQAAALAQATAEGVERAQRAPALAEQREQMNGFLRSTLTNPNRVRSDAAPPAPERERDEGGRFTGGLDQGNRGAGAGAAAPPQDVNTQMNERLRGRLATRKDEES
jgi:hypothetical protein